MVYFGFYYFATDQEKPFCAWIYDLWARVKPIVCFPHGLFIFFFQNTLTFLEVILVLAVEPASLKTSNHL